MALAEAEERTAVAEAETLLERLMREDGPDPRRLEQVEDRLFGLRAAARKHGVALMDLPALLIGSSLLLTSLDRRRRRRKELLRSLRQHPPG
jgi:DNA repair protein RecN (Recombination protein N)